MENDIYMESHLHDILMWHILKVPLVEFIFLSAFLGEKEKY